MMSLSLGTRLGVDLKSQVVLMAYGSYLRPATVCSAYLNYCTRMLLKVLLLFIVKFQYLYVNRLKAIWLLMKKHKLLFILMMQMIFHLKMI